MGIINPLIDNNLVRALPSIGVFIYYQFLTFAVGFSIFPFKEFLLEKFYENIFAAWLIGFNIFNLLIILTGCFWRINTSSIFLLNVLLWVVVFRNRKKVTIFFAALIKIKDGLKDRRYRILLTLILPLVAAMFFSSLVPPTKIDELSYSIYYTKKVSMEGRFNLLYSPSTAFTYMAVPIYNLWFYIQATEYAPALNSFFYYVIAVFLLFVWSKNRFGENIAILASLITAFSLNKIISCIAPGDNGLNFLLLMFFMMISYDLFIDFKQDNNVSSEKYIGAKLFIFYLVFCTSVVVKATSILLVLPVAVFFHIFLFNKILPRKKYFLFATCAFLAIFPYLVKAYLLYNNFLFPFALDIFGAGPIDVTALKEGFKEVMQGSPINATRNLRGLLESPFLYLNKQMFFMHPFSWFLIPLGGIRLLKTRAYYAVLGAITCYVLAFYALPHYFDRFYLGALDFLTVFGLVEFFELIPGRLRESSVRPIRILTVFASIVITAGVFVYYSQFMGYLFLNQGREAFIKPRVECFDTIEWINKNLPKGSFLIAGTRARYYYDIKTEYFDTNVLGMPKDAVQNTRAFRDFLKEKGVTHLMVAKYADNLQENAYDLFCKNTDFCQLVYENNNEIILAGRWIKPAYGKTAVYRIK